MNKVTIIITTYLESTKPYLDLCIESIKNLNYKNYEVLIVSHKNYQPQYEGCTTLAPDKDQFYPAEAINLGMRMSDPESKYFFILNDDAIMTKHSLGNLVEAVGDKNLMANGISPCDQGIAYNLMFGFMKNGVFNTVERAQYRLDELRGVIPEMMNADSIYPIGIVHQNYLCIYATLIPRKLYEAVGDWDEKFKCGQDDLDYSIRAQTKGFHTVSVLNALIWHFSGVTAETTLNLKLRQANVAYFKEKWGFWPPGLDEKFLERT